MQEPPPAAGVEPAHVNASGGHVKVSWAERDSTWNSMWRGCLQTGSEAQSPVFGERGLILGRDESPEACWPRERVKDATWSNRLLADLRRGKSI